MSNQYVEMGLRAPVNLTWEVTYACNLSCKHFSLCGMLLRLRQLYKWEHGLAPWREPEVPAVL